MDIMLRRALRKYNGLRHQLDKNLLSEKGERVADELKKFLREEPCWVSEKPTPSAVEPRIELISTQVSVLHTAEKNKIILAQLDHWRQFCKEFKLKEEIDFEAAKEKVLTRPKGFDWVIYTPSRFTSREAIDRLCSTQFTVFESHPAQSYRLERQPNKARLILCRLGIEPDTEWRISSDTLAVTPFPFLDCRECYILEGFYYNLTKKHLNIKGYTRCPRSRNPKRDVAGVHWDASRCEFCACCFGPGDGSPSGGGREVVILET